MEADWASNSVDQEQQPSRLAPRHRLLKYVMGMLLSQAHCEQMLPHQCAINSLDGARIVVVVVVVFNPPNTGNDIARALKDGKQLHSLRRVDVERSAARSTSS